MKTDNDKLISSFKELYLIEKKAHDLYESKLAETLTDIERGAIHEIHDDEERHMEIANKIVEMIEEQK